MTAPLCDAGRCAQMVEALAVAKARMVQHQADQLLAVLSAVMSDPEMAASEAQRALLPVLLERHVAAIAGRTAA